MLHQVRTIRVGWWTPAEQAYDAKRGTPAARGYDSEWRQIRAVYLKRNPRCVECGERATDVDHIKPLSKGGTHDDDNLQALCHACHSYKTVHFDRPAGKIQSKNDVQIT